MKHTLLLAAALMAFGSQAQIFQSGFEDWTGTSPDGWMGSTTSIGASNVTEVTTDVHGGTKAVALAVPNATHKRFSTTDLTVTDGTTYTISFWIRGVGDIRTGLFDGRSGNGYATYNAYATATSTWTQVTQVIAAANDTVGAQFILSVRGTATVPASVVVDDVTITSGASIATVSIYDIQYSTAADGASPLVGQTVMTGGVVSAIDVVKPNGDPQNVYYIQDASGPWRGVYVFDFPDSGNNPQIGDSITLTATVVEYFGLTELSGISDFTIVQSGLQPHAALNILSGEVVSEALESVLVQISGAACTEIPGGANFGKWKADDGSGDAVIGKEMYTTTPNPTLGQVYDVTGVVSFGFDEYNIQPRMALDIDLITGIRDAGVLSAITFGPNPATDLLHISFGTAAGLQMDYTLTDLQGRTLQAGQFTGDRAQINVSDMATGLYHITLRSNALVKTFAVQVAH